MFLNPTLRSYVDPFLFPGRLFICADTDDQKDCWVFSGRHVGFRDPASEPVPSSSHGVPLALYVPRGTPSSRSLLSVA